MSQWPRVPLGEISESIDYGVTASASEQPLGPRFLRITDIQDNSVNWGTVPWCSCSERELESSRLQSGDIVFARTGATTGKSYLIGDCPPDTVFASYLIRVRPKESVEPSFISHFFQTSDYWGQITKGARGAAQPGVNATTLKALEIPFPPQPEQRRIAAILDQAEALRAKRREALAQLEELQQAIFIEMFGDPATNPKGWPIQPFGNQFHSVRYGTGSPPPYSETGVPFVRATNIKAGRISTKDLKHISVESALKLSKCRVNHGNIIVVRSGVNTGDCAVIPKEFDGACAAFDLIVDIEYSGAVFYAFLINSEFGRRTLEPLTRRAAQPHLNAEQLQTLPLIAPPAKLREEFTKRMEGVERLRGQHLASSLELDALFMCLQHRAFQGTF